MAYVMRPLIPDDLDMLLGYLRPRTERAYFLRANAARAGLEWHEKPYQAEYVGVFSADQMVGVMAYTWMNTILVDAVDPDAIPIMMPWLHDRLTVRGGKIEAILGAAVLAQKVIDLLPVADSDLRLNKDEGLFQKRMDDASPTILPIGLTVRRANESDLSLIADWRADFNVEAIGLVRSDVMHADAQREMTLRIAEGEIFILCHDDRPVSFCGSSGNLPDAMWIGPVWTPVAMRNRGYARHAVAGCVNLIASERPMLTQAALIAGNPAAIRAYEAIGFCRIADWRLAFCQENFVWQKKNQKR